MIASRIRLAVFDLDGTLVDSQHAIVASMRAAFESQDLMPPEAAAVRSVIGLPLDAAIEQINPDVRGLLTQRVAEGYKHHAQAVRGASAGGPEPLMPGARAVLDRLEADGCLLAIATGKGRRGLISVLEAHGLRNRFVSLQSADDAPGKPDPTMLRQAIAEAGAEHSEAVMIGDTVFDLQMAHNAGVASVAVSWGYHQVEHLNSAGPGALINHFDELDAVINDLIGPATKENT
ncbi:MAG: HAD-IA family hydrolase [Alphaproteobacteria bacterium]|jgi:phosphoglycolate phosphatase|nr:HAD-IA family hydrolase [Alphaproteobacteria bacterium]